MEVMLYPYDRESYPIVIYHDMIKELEIKSLVSPRGWGLDGKIIINESQSYVL